MSSTSSTAAASVGRSETTKAGAVAAVLASLSVGAVAALYGAPLVGVLTAASLLVTWYVLGIPYAFSAGEIGVAGLASAWPVGALVAVQVPLIALLVAPDVAPGGDRRRAVTTGTLILGLGGVVLWVQVTLARTWLAAVVLLAVAGLAGYGLHRYELLATGQLDPPEDGG